MDEALMQLLMKKDFEFITVKEICLKAGVNRSTFYLHYDSTKDLLLECNELLVERFSEKFNSLGIMFKNMNIDSDKLDDLIFINKEYLTPYLYYIKENANTYKAIYKYPELFNAIGNYKKIFKDVFAPILARFGVNNEDSVYVMEYYIKGVSAIIVKWVNGGCETMVDKLVEIIISCIRPDDKRL